LTRWDRQHLLEYRRLRVKIEEWARQIEAEGEVVETPAGGENGSTFATVADESRGG